MSKIIQRWSRPLLAAGFLAAASAGTADDAFWKFWNNPAGGSFHDGSNWLNGAPEFYEDAVFDIGAEEAYPVTFAGAAETYMLLLGTDNVLFQLNGNTYTLRQDLFLAHQEDDVASLVVEGGSMILENRFDVGRIGAGHLEVKGEGTTLSAAGVRPRIGNMGPGTALISDGATLSVVSDLRIALEEDSRLTVDGGHLVVQGGLHLSDGANAHGEAIFRNGAMATISNRFDIGRTGSGYLELRDPGTVLNVSGTRPRIGRSAPGDAVIADGATMNVLGSDLRISWEGAPGDRSTLLVDGGNLNIDGGLHVSDGPTTIGEATFTNGAQIDVGNRFDIGREGVGSLEVSGANTLLTVGGVNSRIGRNKAGTALFSDGATVNVAGDLRVAWLGDAGETSILTVDNAVLDVEGYLAAADSGSVVAEIYVENGATVTAGGLNIGNHGATTFDLTGAGTTLSAGSMRIGTNGEAVMTVSDGAVLAGQDENDLNIATNSGSEGTLVLTGSGSRLEGSALGLFIGGSREVWVDDGEGGGEFTGGVGGTGRLDVLAGGEVDIGGEVVVWRTGTLHVEDGTIRASSIRFADGVGEDSALLSLVLDAASGPFLDMSGDFTLGSNARLELAVNETATFTAGQKFVVASAGGEVTGTFAGLAEGAVLTVDDVDFSISYQGSEVALTVQGETTGLTYGAWIAGFELPAADQAFDANPSGDGIPNAIKYALGLDPTVSSVGEVPVAKLEVDGGEQYLEIQIAKNQDAVEAVFTMEVSSDLINWEDGDESVLVIEETDTLLHARDRTALSDLSKRFMRFRVEIGIQD